MDEDSPGYPAALSKREARCLPSNELSKTPQPLAAHRGRGGLRKSCLVAMARKKGWIDQCFTPTSFQRTRGLTDSESEPLGGSPRRVLIFPTQKLGDVSVCRARRGTGGRVWATS